MSFISALAYAFQDRLVHRIESGLFHVSFPNAIVKQASKVDIAGPPSCFKPHSSNLSCSNWEVIILRLYTRCPPLLRGQSLLLSRQPNVIYSQTRLFTLRNKCNDHPVEIIEEREQVKAELDETLLLVSGEGAKDFCCVIHVIFVSYLVDIKSK